MKPIIFLFAIILLAILAGLVLPPTFLAIASTGTGYDLLGPAWMEAAASTRPKRVTPCPAPLPSLTTWLGADLITTCRVVSGRNGCAACSCRSSRAEAGASQNNGMPVPGFSSRLHLLFRAVELRP
jgi:hypothetical protein